MGVAMMNNKIKCRIGDVSKVYAGGTPSRKHPEYWGGSIPWVKTTHIQNCVIERNDIDETITDIGLKSSSARIVPKGTILMAMIGQGKTRGQVAILNVEAAINQNCVAIVLNEDIDRDRDRDYVWHQLLFRYNKIRNISNSSGQQNLNGEIIKSIVLPFPDYEQQCLIGNLLNQWDTAIEKTEALIDAKEHQFDWLRFKLFESCQGDLYKLNNLEKLKLIKMGRGNIISKKDIKEIPGQYPIYSSSVKKNGMFGKYGKFMFEQELITWSVDGGGDFFYRPKHKFSITNVCGHIIVDEAKIDYYFLAAQLQQLHTRLVFDYQFKAHPSVIRKIYNVKLPLLTEQKRISEILNTAKKEINMLRELADQYRTQKRGLMQKLLTGKWRVKA